MMIDEPVLQELLGYAPSSPVLSVYLDLDPQDAAPDSHRARLREVLRPVEEEAEDDIEAILHHFDYGRGHRGRSLAMFSHRAGRFFRAYSFDLPIRSRARWSDRPYIKPLADLLDNYGNNAVALVDQRALRLFRFHLGHLEEEAGTLGEPVRRTKRGGASSFPGRLGGIAGRTRHAEETAERNLRESAQAAAAYFQSRRARRIMMGGLAATIGRFRSLLPKTWQSLVVAEFSIEMDAGIEEIQQRALNLAEAAESRAEHQRVQALVTAAAKGQDGVVHLDETLRAVQQGRVMTMFVRDGFRAPGFQCTGCGDLTSIRPLNGCPYCGKAYREIPDAVELAVRRVLRDGGDVDVVGPTTGLEEAGSIGARLRY
jgi:peptide chain release factor subunit 1